MQLTKTDVMPSGSLDKVGLDIGLIGGGRWARAIASVLLQLKLDNRRILVCSPGHREGWGFFKQSLEEKDRHRIEIVSTIERLLSTETVGSVLVARSAKDQAQTAISALEAEKNCFIEKPFALNLPDAERVVAAAKGRRCIVGLVFLFANNLRVFSQATSSIGKFDRLDIVWTDPCAEQRGGEIKRYDASINVLYDVFPHVWSMIALLLDPKSLNYRQIEIDDGGRIVKLRLAAGACEITIHMERDAACRKRLLTCRGGYGRSWIDFSKEPGRAEINGKAIDIGGTFKSPLQRELRFFLGLLEETWPMQFAHVDQAIQSVSLIDPLRAKIKERQIAAIRSGLHERAVEANRRAAKFALRELYLGLQDIDFADAEAQNIATKFN